MGRIAWELTGFGDEALDAARLTDELAELSLRVWPRQALWMGYYRNETVRLAEVVPASWDTAWSVRPYRQFQEAGLPGRITGLKQTSAGALWAAGPLDQQRKEVVIENDIAWRMNTLVDFCVGQMPAVSSTAPDPARRALLTAVLQGLLEASGGAALLQSLTLLGAVHGSAYLHIKTTQDMTTRLGRPPASPQPEAPAAAVVAAAGAVRLELIDAGRVLPLRSPGMALEEMAYAAVLPAGATRRAPWGADRAAAESTLARVTRWLTGQAPPPRAAPAGLTLDLWGPGHWQRYDGGVLVDEAANPLGLVPVVAFVNQPTPPSAAGVGGEGQSEVEPLIGLQDELNTRLSDRANRVTLQSFRMYLARGLEDFITRPVGPGQMWATDNPQASIETFGGDAACPGEEAHINEIREALDKISGVPPVAAGLLKARLGNLTSAVALRITLIALLARTEKRRAALTRTLRVVCRRMLELLDRAGLVTTTPSEREIDVNWPSPLPENLMEKLQEAKAKLELGVPQAVVLRELGYEELVLEALPGAGLGGQPPAVKEESDGGGTDGAGDGRRAPAGGAPGRAEPGGAGGDAGRGAGEGDGVAESA